MELIFERENGEYILSPKTRDTITKANEELNRLDKSKKEYIEAVFDYKLSVFYRSNPDPDWPQSLASSILPFLSQDTTLFLLGMITNYEDIGRMREKLENEELISKNTSEFTFKLAAKYGHEINDIIFFISDPYKWTKFTIDTLILSREEVKIQFEFLRRDRQIVSLSTDLADSLKISKMLLQKLIDSVELVDKELILSCKQKEIDKLEGLISKIKDIRKSIHSDAKQIDKTEISREKLTPAIEIIVFSRDEVKLQIKFYCEDRQITFFRADLKDSVQISRKILQGLIDSVELVNKELILSCKQEELDLLEDLINKIKDIRKSVESDIKQIDKSEQTKMNLHLEL